MRQWGELVANPDAELPPTTSFLRILNARTQADAQRRERDREYWNARAATLPPGPRLPYATAPEQVRSSRFRRHEAKVEPPQWSALTVGPLRAG
jgi:hypothetical protein